LRTLFTFLAYLFFAGILAAQNTTVTATVTGPNGVIWAQATGSAQLICPGNAQAYRFGTPVPRNYPIPGLDSTASFTQVLIDTTGLLDVNNNPISCQYQYSFTDQCGIASFTTGLLTGITGPGPINLTTQIHTYTPNVSTQCASGAGGFPPVGNANDVQVKSATGTLAAGCINSPPSPSVTNFNCKAATLASTSSTAGLEITPGAAPTSPSNGDIWNTNGAGGGLYARINGATNGPFRSIGASVWCVNNTTTDTNNLQAAITAAEGANSSGVVDVQGSCSIDGTLITFGTHTNRYLTLNIWGSIQLVNGGFKPTSFTAFLGSGALAGGGGADNPMSGVIGPAYVNVPVFELSGVEGVILDHLYIFGGGLNSPAVYLHIDPVSHIGTVKTTIRYSYLLAGYNAGTQGPLVIPVRYDDDGTGLSAFGLNLIGNSYGNTYGSGATTAPCIYLAAIGDVFITSPEGDFNRFNGCGIEINPAPTNIGSITINFGFGEAARYNDFIVVDSGGIVTDLNIFNTGLSDNVTNPYLLINKGSTVNPVRITGQQLGVQGILDPASTGTTQIIKNDWIDFSLYSSIPGLGGGAPPGYPEFNPSRISDLRRNSSPVRVQYTNLLQTGYWDGSALPTVSGCTLTSGQTDPTGGAHAAGVTCTTGNSYAPALYNSGTSISVGDVFIAGVASKANNTSLGFRSYVGATLSSTGGNTTLSGPAFNVTGDVQAGYNKYWAFQYSIQKVTATIGTPSSVQFQLSASDTQPATFAFPFVLYIPASAGLSDHEIMEIARTYVSTSPNAPVGTISAATEPNTDFAMAGAGDPYYARFTHTLTQNQNFTLQNLSGPLTVTIASGTASLGTSSISSATCATAVTVAGAGIATTDAITFNFNGDPTGITGYAPSASGTLYIYAYPTAGNVNFKVCNNTSGPITPGAATLNWRVTR
jgi:hypothetical protein